ncbi:hypothetical protein WME99_40295 [Sorangium sp. So ce136]|uniref:hypothetical protein n=1 Tax=Sorangium sp. So ce136 TaxID=3133284 RepID=UPI003F0C1B9C
MFNKMHILVSAMLLGGAVATFAGDSAAGEIHMMPMTAQPRSGNDACWEDNGAQLKNICATTQMVTFMSDIGVNSNTVVSALVYSSSHNTSLECQAVTMSAELTSWSVGFRENWGTMLASGPATNVPLNGTNAVTLHSDETYSIDCWVPAGSKLGSARINF